MRRLALIFGLVLTLTASVWGSALAAAASAWCAHEADATAVAASDEHDCCRAKIGEPDTHHSESPQTSHDAAHGTSTTHEQAGASHAGMNCGGAETSSAPEIAASLGGRSCVECCAGVPGKTPATAVFVTPEQNKVKRDAGGDCASVSDLFASATLDVSHLAPSQHAPPAPPGRRHILISVFLI